MGNRLSPSLAEIQKAICWKSADSSCFSFSTWSTQYIHIKYPQINSTGPTTLCTSSTLDTAYDTATSYPVLQVPVPDKSTKGISESRVQCATRCPHASRIHPYTAILPQVNMHESWIPNARVVQAAEDWD